MLYTIEGLIDAAGVIETEIERIMKFATQNLDLKGVNEINIVMNHDLGDVAGLVDEIDEGEFEIEINATLPNSNFTSFIETLIHEMIHVSQIARGDLKLGWPSSWKGKEYSGEYMELPWEVEAYSLEQELTTSYIFG